MRVWVTRDEGPEGPLCAALRARGLEPVLEPVVARRVVGDAREEIARLGADGWLVLTSACAVRAIAADAARCRVAAVGEGTAEAARARGLRVDLVGPDGTGAGLWGVVRERVRAGRVCFPRSSLAAAPPAWGGVEVCAPVVYETLAVEFDRSVARRAGVAAVTSPSAAAALRSVEGLPRCASIGPTTSAALRGAGIKVWAEAGRASFGALAEAIASGLAGSR